MFHLIAAAILASNTYQAPCSAPFEPAALTADVSVEEILANAEESFLAHRNELGLTGAAPLYGTQAEELKPIRNARRLDAPRRRGESRATRLSAAPQPRR